MFAVLHVKILLQINLKMTSIFSSEVFMLCLFFCFFLTESVQNSMQNYIGTWLW